MTRKYLLTIALLIPLLSNAQNKDFFTDARDGQTYETVSYLIPASSTVITDLDEYGTYVKKEPTNYEVKLSDQIPASITWMAENLNVDLPESKCYKDTEEGCAENGREYTWHLALKACPQGWHLPSDDEWYLLASLYGGVAVAGEHLKSTALNGTNKSLFNVKRPSIYWSSDEMDTDQAWDWKLNFRWQKLQRWKGGKHFYNAVRCVQDY